MRSDVSVALPDAELEEVAEGSGVGDDEALPLLLAALLPDIDEEPVRSDVSVALPDAEFVDVCVGGGVLDEVELPLPLAVLLPNAEDD